MSFASKGYVESRIRAVDSKFSELITSGAQFQGTWNASTNTPKITQGVGTNGWWYEVSQAGLWEGMSFRIGDKIMFSSKSNEWEQIPTGVEQDDVPMIVGFINENSSFPTTRPSGKDLVIGDYLKVDSSANLPFDIGDITFDSYKDEAEWNGTSWQEKSYNAGLTNEIGVYKKDEESLNKKSEYQNEINKEVAKIIGQEKELDVDNIDNIIDAINYIFKQLNIDIKEDMQFIGVVATAKPPITNIFSLGNICHVTNDFKPEDITTTITGYEVVEKTEEELTTLVWSDTETTYTFKNNDLLLDYDNGILYYYSNNKLNEILNSVFIDVDSLDKITKPKQNVIYRITDNSINYRFYCYNGTKYIEIGEDKKHWLEVDKFNFYGDEKILYFLNKDFEKNEFVGLKLTSDEDNSSVEYQITGSITKDIYYSDDGSTWTSWDGTAITLNKGHYIYVWNKSNTLSTSVSNYFQFVMTGKIKASGNVDSMINFSSLKNYCYVNMFYGCESLIATPELPSTTLALACYFGMFIKCSALTQAPELPAATLADYCYEAMFSGCSSLTQAPELPATNLNIWCYENMFSNCSSLTQAPELPSTNLAEGCYFGMFVKCSALTQAPELPSMTLVSSCYDSMFDSCSSLNQIKLVNYVGNFNGGGTSSPFYHWVKGVSPTGTFYYNGSSTTRGISAIPTGWTIERF